MARKSSLLLVPFFLGMFESAEGASGTIMTPSNPKLKTFPDVRKLCVVFEWTSSCETKDSICRTTLKLTTKDGRGGSLAQTKELFIPPTAADNRTHYQCVYDAKKENSTCCSDIVPGLTAQEAIQTDLSTTEIIEIGVKVCFNYSGNCVMRTTPFSFVAPWKDPCRLSKPCGHYGNCVTVKADVYNCTCKSDWEGRNCSSLKGITVFKDKCVADGTKALRNESNKEQEECLYLCKATKECKSFVFTPDSAGSKTGSCKLFSGNTQDYKLMSCPGKSFMELPEDTNPTGGTEEAITTSFYALLVAVIANMVFL